MTQSELCILLHLSFSLCFHNIIFWNFITDLENMFFHWNGFSFSSRDLLSLPQQTIQEVKIWNCFSCSFHRLHCQQGQILLIANAVPMQDWHPGSIILGIWRHTLGPHCTKGLCPCFSTPGSPTQHVCVSWNLPSQLTPLPHGNMLVSYNFGRLPKWGMRNRDVLRGCKPVFSCPVPKGKQKPCNELIMWTACKSLKSRRVKEGTKGVSLKRVWIFLVESLGSHLLVVSSPIRHINSCTFAQLCLSSASFPCPLRPSG